MSPRSPSSAWPSLPPYETWQETCDTLHAHTQVLGKLAVELAPPEPQLQHAALRLTARGWETNPLPARDGSGALVAALDLGSHEAVIEHSDGSSRRVALTPDRSVRDVTREVLAAVGALGGSVDINPAPQEVPWTVPLTEDTEHARYDVDHVIPYFTAATQVALVLAAFRAPYRGRSTPVNAWWGSFDLVVNLFSGFDADPPRDDFITRNSMDVEEFAFGWWPGDARYGGAAFFAYAYPVPPDYADGALPVPGASWHADLGLYLLDWDDVRSASDPHAFALEFARSTFRIACEASGWESRLPASAEGAPPPVH